MPGVEHALFASGDADLPGQIETAGTLGFAIERRRYQCGFHCTAVSLRVAGQAVAGLCLNGSAQRLPQKWLEAIARFVASEALKVASVQLT